MSTGPVLSATVGVPPATAAPPLPRPVIGIDIAKKLCDIILITSHDEEPVHVRVPHAETAAKVSELVPSGPLTIAMEYTGGLALPVLEALDERPETVILIASDTDSAALRQLLRRPRKSDKLDAELIARMLLLSLTPETAPLLAGHLTPWETLKRPVLARRAVRDLQALIGDRVRIELRAKRLAPGSAQAKRLETLHTAYREQIRAAEKALVKDQGEEVQLLASLPGVTPRRATIFLAAIGDVRRFPSPDHLVRYVGLTPSHRPSSGDKATGPKQVRRVSTLLAQELHMWGIFLAGRPGNCAGFGQSYLQVKARHDGRVAMWHCRRKLIRACWHILTTKQPWDPARSYPKPQKPVLTLPGDQL